MQKYWKVTFKQGGCYVLAYDQLDAFIPDAENSSVGDVWTLEVIEMTDEEREALPEFEGH